MVIGERGGDRFLATYHLLAMAMDKEFEACGDRLKDEMHFFVYGSGAGEGGRASAQ